MRRVKKWMIPFFIIAIMLVALQLPITSGVLLTDDNDRPLQFIAWEGKNITLQWRHSVELTPWQETYHINENGSLSFQSTTYKSYGAGTPDTDGHVEFLNNGFVRVTGINRKMDYLSIFYVPISNYCLLDGSTKYPLIDFVPDDTKIRIYYKQLKLYQWLQMKCQ